MATEEVIASDVRSLLADGEWSAEDSQELKKKFRIRFQRKQLNEDEVAHALGEFHISENVARKFFQLCDKDNSGLIDPEELGNFFDRLVGVNFKHPHLLWFIAFKLLDDNQNGFLDANEIDKGAKLLGIQFDKEPLANYFATYKISGFTCDQFLQWIGQA